jgi:methylglutaconyl-CoA hydratase
MHDFQTLRVEVSQRVMHVTMQRPEVHNAFNDVFIGEMIELFDSASADGGLRAIVLRGEGKSFCAGADLTWMSKMIDYTREENIRDSAELAKMFAAIDGCPLPVIGRIHGAALGGGAGLVSVCDIAIAAAGARFGLTEVKLGLVPSVISPYVIAKIGAGEARALFLTGERFAADRALRIGLVHGVTRDEEELDAEIERLLEELRGSAPGAVRASKSLIAHVSSVPRSDAIPYTIEAIAERRTSDEGQGGMRAFLGKEATPWSRG